MCGLREIKVYDPHNTDALVCARGRKVLIAERRPREPVCRCPTSGAPLAPLLFFSCVTFSLPFATDFALTDAATFDPGLCRRLPLRLPPLISFFVCLFASYYCCCYSWRLPSLPLRPDSHFFFFLPPLFRLETRMLAGIMHRSHFRYL